MPANAPQALGSITTNLTAGLGIVRRISHGPDWQSVQVQLGAALQCQQQSMSQTQVHLIASMNALFVPLQLPGHL